MTRGWVLLLDVLIISTICWRFYLYSLVTTQFIMCVGRGVPLPAKQPFTGTGGIVTLLGSADQHFFFGWGVVNLGTQPEYLRLPCTEMLPYIRFGPNPPEKAAGSSPNGTRMFRQAFLAADRGKVGARMAFSPC